MQNIHILVVDDESEITDLVELYLVNEGFRVTKFYDPGKALEAIKNTLSPREEGSQETIGFLRIFGDFLCAQKVTRRRHGQADSATSHAK